MAQYSYKYNGISGNLDLVTVLGNTIWGYVATYALLPLGVTSNDPQIGDLVGVDNAGGGFDNGFYKRSNMTGIAATDYGTEPYAGYPNTANQATTDAGLVTDEYVSPSTLAGYYRWATKENTITAGTTAQYWRGDKTFQTLDTLVVPENTNLYFTNARGIGSTLTGYISGAGVVSAADSILSAIQKVDGNISALGTPVPTSRILTINGTAFDLSTDRTWTVGDALVANPLSQFAATTSAQLAGIISDETGGSSGLLVFNNAPSIKLPIITDTTTPSKELEFQLSGATASTMTTLIFNQTVNRTVTFPDFNIVVAGSTAALTSGKVPIATTGGRLTDSTISLNGSGIDITAVLTLNSGVILSSGSQTSIRTTASVANNITGASLKNTSTSGSAGIEFGFSTTLYSQLHRFSASATNTLTANASVALASSTLLQAGITGTEQLVFLGSPFIFCTGTTVGNYGMRISSAGVRIDLNSNLHTAATKAFDINGDINLNTAGNGIYIKEGTNATMGTGTLVGGTLVVNTTKVTANSRIVPIPIGTGVAQVNAGSLSYAVTTPGTSFTVYSTNILDTRAFIWIIFEPA